jgi:hypothetical protein
MSFPKVLSVLVISILILTTLLPSMVPAAPGQSRGPLPDPKVPGFNYTWETRDKEWDWWNYANSPVDTDHMFFVYENKVLFVDLVANTTKEVTNITYKSDTDPNGPDHNSTLYGIKASKLDDGRYHVAILENQELNNLTARYLFLMVVNPDGKVINWTRPIGNKTVMGMDLDLVYCHAITGYGTLIEPYHIFWNKTGANNWTIYHWGSGGSSGPIPNKWLVSVSYNRSDGYYTVLYLPQGANCIEVNWISIMGQGHGIGGFYACINSNWGIMALDTAYNNDGHINTLKTALMEQNVNDGKYRVEFLADWEYYNHYPIWPGNVYDEIGNILDPFYAQGYNIAIAAGDGVACMFFPTIPQGWGGGSIPSYVTALFIDMNGTVLGNATSDRLVGGTLQSFMVGHTFYIGGAWETTGGAMPPKFKLFIDKVTPHFYGDWALSDLQVAPQKDLYSVNETVSLTIRPSSEIGLLNLTWMEPCSVNISIDGVRTSPVPWVLEPAARLDVLHFEWTAILGNHNLTLTLEVPQDTNRTNNTITVLVSVGWPDLVLANFTTSLSALEPGINVHFAFNLSNIGADLTSALLELFLGPTRVWTRQVLDLTNGYNESYNQSLQTASFPFGTFDLTIKALPQNSSDNNWSDNQLSTKLRVYNPKIEVFVDSPKAEDHVARTLKVTGHVQDPENETVSVWADLKAGFFSNTTLTVKTKGEFELSMDLSKVVVGRYSLTVHANGTLGRSALSVLDIFVQNGPYWTFLSPSGNTTSMNENSTMNFSARATDWGTNRTVKVNWTFDGKDATGLKDVTMIQGGLSYFPGYDGAGFHTIKAEAFNLFGRISHIWTVNVTNVNRPPEILSVIPFDSVKIVLGGQQNFTATAEDPDGDGLNYTWKIGNDTFYGPTITYKPDTAGNRTMFLYVSDGKISAVYEWTIVVVTKGIPPIIPPPVKHPTTVQSDWAPWLILIVVLASASGLVGYYFMKEQPPRKGPAKGLKGSNK